MKKLLAILAIGTLLVGCQPEAVKAQTYVMASANVSIVDGGTSYLSAQALAQKYNTVSFQATLTKVSGTVDGSSYIQGSNDGINYKTLTVAEADTLAIDDVSSQTHIWRLYGNPYKYYRIASVGTGTMVATQSGLFCPRR